MKKLKVGDKVTINFPSRLYKGSRKYAKVLRLMTYPKGGIEVDCPLYGFRYWNEESLKRIES